ncbi:GNAT family N-acetyltransferase [Colwellia sp. MEBiC06753]
MQISNSERLSYRLLGQQDEALFFDLDSDPEVMRFINGGKTPTIDEIRQVSLPRLAKYTNAEQGWGMWGVFLEPSKEFIGWVLVRPMNFFSDKPNYGELEIGWRLMRKTWGKGYATEAAQQVVNALREHKAAPLLAATAITENIGSINVMEKLGMHLVKHYVHAAEHGEVDAVYYRMSLAKDE